MAKKRKRNGVTGSTTSQQFNSNTTKNANSNSTEPATITPAMIANSKYIENYDFPLCGDSKKYVKEVKISQGRFGEIFKAHEMNPTKKCVVMKKVAMDSENQDFPMKALREIRILKLLKHENIVNLIEICSTKATANNRYRSTIYLVFDFCEYNLADLLSNIKIKFSLGEIKKMIHQLLNGLYYIHGSNILHRDLRAANVLITKNGVLKLADFGSARSIGVPKKGKANCYTNEVVTLWYRSPELLLGDRNYGPSVDMWGAGCIMAEMCTRSPIMPGQNEQQQIMFISQLCGSITPNVWPDVQNLEYYSKLELPLNHKRELKDRLKSYVNDPHGCDLLDRLLQLDPKARINADAALNHTFFWTEPMPCSLAKTLTSLQSSYQQINPSPMQNCTQDNNLTSFADRIY